MRIKQSQLGFSMLELIIVMAILLVMAGFSVITLQTSMRSSRVDTASKTVMMTLRQARQQAIDTRDIWQVQFAAPGSITMTRLFANGTTITYPTVTLPTDVSFQLIAGRPTVSTGARPTPDSIGVGAYAIDFSANSVRGSTLLYFYPDGSAKDSTARPNNGVVYFGRTGELSSYRAVSVYGSTGRIKGWRLQLDSVNGNWWR
jgi:prepilin-type N-terminal cleavage/methylation domain-containing protein